MRQSSLGAGLTLAMISATGSAAEPVRLLPEGPWNLRFDDEACRLVRMFGPDDNRVQLTLAKYGDSSRFEVILAGRGLKAKISKIRSRFLPDEGFDVYELPLYGTSADGVTAWQWSGGLLTAKQTKELPDSSTSDSEDFKALEDARLAEIDGFEVDADKQPGFVLVTGKIANAFAGLDTCLADLVTTWGFDPAEQKALVSKPKPRSNPGSWISWGDYPETPLAKGISGMVRFRLHVDTAGLPTKCVVQAAFSDPAFKKVTCDLLMQKARFEPARSASGAPVESYWVSSVKWIS